MFGCQRVEKVPREAHDQSLPGVVTEDGVVSFG
jgi:5-formyltetrahydrofolate cyclo-ligase